MVTEEKIKEIRKLLRNGEPQGELIEKLKREGYSEEDIGKIFTAHTYDMRSWYLTFAIIFLLYGFYLVIAAEDFAGFLMLLFSALMFLVYYREVQRLKNRQEKISGRQEKKSGQYSD